MRTFAHKQQTIPSSGIPRGSRARSRVGPPLKTAVASTPYPQADGKNSEGRSASSVSTRFGHDFSRTPLGPDQKLKVSESGRADLDAPEPDDFHRRAQTGGGGAGGGSGAGAGSAASGPSASLAITGDGAYADTATESRKNVKFNATWSGGSKEDYVIVNWLKGHMKKPDGKPYKVTMYGSSVDFDFSSWRVDSVDADATYWSSGGVRWRYTVDGPNKFSATDSPGPMYTKDGKGAQAKVDFKTAVYKSSDVPKTTTGTISATPLSSFEPWTYHVEVLGGGKFNHKL